VKGQENESRAKRDGKKDFRYERGYKEVSAKGVVCSYSNMRKGITSELQEKRAHLSEKERAELQAKDKAKAAEEKVIKTETAQREKCLDGYKKEIAAKGKAPSKWAVCTYSDMRKGYTTELGAKHAQQVEDRKQKEERQIKSSLASEKYKKSADRMYADRMKKAYEETKAGEKQWKKMQEEMEKEKTKKPENLEAEKQEKYKKTMEKEEKEKMKKPDTMEKMAERQKKSDEKQMKFMSKEREAKSRENGMKVRIVKEKAPKENSHKDTLVYTTRRV